MANRCLQPLRQHLQDMFRTQTRVCGLSKPASHQTTFTRHVPDPLRVFIINRCLQQIKSHLQDMFRTRFAFLWPTDACSPCSRPHLQDMSRTCFAFLGPTDACDPLDHMLFRTGFVFLEATAACSLLDHIYKTCAGPKRAFMADQSLQPIRPH